MFLCQQQQLHQLVTGEHHSIGTCMVQQDQGKLCVGTLLSVTCFVVPSVR